MVTPRAMSAVAASGVRVVCSLGCAQPRKLASSGSWALSVDNIDGNRHR